MAPEALGQGLDLGRDGLGRPARVGQRHPGGGQRREVSAGRGRRGRDGAQGVALGRPGWEAQVEALVGTGDGAAVEQAQCLGVAARSPKGQGRGGDVVGQGSSPPT